MADAEVQLQPDGSGKQVDTGTVVTGAGTVHRQRVAIGDPATGSAIAEVSSAGPGATDFALVVRPINQNWVRQINLNPTATTVGASATFDSRSAPASITLDLGSLASGGASYSKWRVFVHADQPGTLNMQQSPDNTNWYTPQSAPYSAGEDLTLESLIVMRYLNAEFVNGTNANTVFVFRAALVSI